MLLLCGIHYTYVCHKVKLGGVQRRLLKFLSFKLNGAYPEGNYDHSLPLDEHDLMLLDIRRDMIGANFMHSLIHNNFDCPSLLELVPIYAPPFGPRNSTTFLAPRCRINYMMRNPVYQMSKSAD
ncbi:hypothetical protein QE152_g4614 [Popillia japonica]|uniref:Uncharacterized protein n=1 Tax=Popillia japonica TaxID=7064 RepID=A0AAW1MZW5_POPJA